MTAGPPPTLGFAAADWIERWCVHGPGDMQGQRVTVTDEALRFLLDAYEVLPVTGRRRRKRAMLVRPKGWAKSELAGFIALFEALGPARFDAWDEDGEPVGRPVQTPIVRIVATEENQAGNIYDVVLFNCQEGPLAPLGLEAGLTRINLPGGGNIRPVSAGAASKDGGKETFVCFALDTPVLTTDGWKAMADVAVGDRVFAPDGTPIEVVDKTPVAEGRDCYRVSFDDGESVVTDDGHRWQVIDSWRRKHSDGPVRVMTTGEMHRAKKTPRQSRFLLEPPAPVQHGKQELPIDPYLFGLWLGDGDKTCATVAMGDEDRDELCRILADGGISTTVYDSTIAVRVNEGGRWQRNSTQTRLREMGLIGNKHVPSEYLLGSVDQRLALLQGLMDSDGSVTESGHAMFVNKSTALCDAVAELVRSMGWRTTGTMPPRGDGTSYVSFTPYGDAPFRLRRKAERCLPIEAQPLRAIRSIEAVPSEPVQCLVVDAPDHLFLVGRSLVPTKNCFDELHLFLLPELHRLHQTYLRNLRKRTASDPWSLETTTAYRPGEGSVAEHAMGYAEKIAAGEALDAGFLYDHRQPAASYDLEDPQQRLSALAEAYGDCDWVDFEQIAADWDDPTTDRVDWQRYFLSRVVVAADAFIDPGEWAAVADAARALHDGDVVALGLDTSLIDDGTALVACRVSDGHLQRLGYWQKPEGRAGLDWTVPYPEVDAAVRAAFDRYTVTRLYCDPQYAEGLIDTWALDFGQRVFRWHTNRASAMASALQRLYVAVRTGDGVAHDGDTLLAQHVGNARTFMSQGRTLVRKEYRHSPRKIDLLVAAVLAFEAAADARAAGEDRPAEPVRRRVWSF